MFHICAARPEKKWVFEQFVIQYRNHMPRLRNAVLLFGTVAYLACSASAEITPNPYSSVVVRNAFSLKDPPPPPVETPPAPVVPNAKVVLTGIISSLLASEPTVLVEITEQEPGKAPTTKRPILRRGDKEGNIEILAVDVVKNQVRIRNGTVETNLLFEIAKSSSSPSAPLPSIPGVVPPLAPTGGSASTHNNNNSPTIISPGGGNSAGRAGTGVSVFGGNSPVAPTAIAAANSGYAGTPTLAMGANGTQPAYPGITTYGSGGVNPPARDLRTDPNAAPTANQVYQNMIRQKVAADQAGIMMPPLPPSPHLQGAGGSPPSPPGLPSFPGR